MPPRPSNLLRRVPASALLGLGVSVFLVASGDLGFGRAALERGGSVEVVLAVLLVVAAAINLVVQAVGWGRALKPLCLVLLLITATSSYFIDSFGVALDVGMLRNALETDVHEARELLGVPFLLHMLVFAGLPGLAIWVLPARPARLRVELLARFGAASALIVLAVGVLWTSRDDLTLFWRANRDLRSRVNPVAPIASAIKLTRERLPRHEQEPRPLARDAHRGEAAAERRRLLVLLVVGETATAGHFSLNGYERDTNPELELRDVLSFTNVHSCATSTAESVPCLFSELGREDFEVREARASENLLDVLVRAGVGVLWRENNSGCKGVCARVEVQYAKDLDPAPELRAPDGEVWDEALLAGLQERFDASSGDQLVVLHQQGSHGPSYYLRTPPAFKRYRPECTRDDVQNCDHDAIVNAYDNTIAYTDHVLASAIDLLRANEGEADVALLYVSDHGESLGENGLYLHGYPYWMAPEEQTHVPMVLWIPERSREDLGVDGAALEAEVALPLSHDNVFHTVLGLFGVETAVYRRELDLFAGGAG